MPNTPLPASSGLTRALAREAAELFPLAHARESVPTPDDVVRDFLSARRPGTLRGYRGALLAFSRAIGAPDVSSAVRALLGATAGNANAVVYRFRNKLVESGAAPATVNSRLGALRSLVRLARMQGLVAWQLEVENVRADRQRDMRGPGRRGVRALLAEVAGATTPMGLRDRALIRVLADLALRRGEAVGLDLEHVDLDGGVVLVLGKGRSGRVPLTLPEPTQAALTDWIAARGDHPGPLFIGFGRGRVGTRLTGASVARIVRRLGEAAGIGHVRPHGLRHAAITQALELTRGDIRAVQRFSRHADPRTLLLYDDSRQDKAGEVARLVAAWR